MEALVPICCLCFKVRDDQNAEVDKGPWVNLSSYAGKRQLPLGHGFLFTHGYCPDCVAHFEKRMAAHRSKNLWESLKEGGVRLMAKVGGRQHAEKRV